MNNEQAGVQLILRRAAAYLLDIVILYLVLAPIGALIQWLFLDRLPQTGPEIWRTLLWNFSLPVWLYFALADSSERGATLGKRLLSLRVVQLDNRPVSKGQALLRTAVKLLPWELVHISAFALSADMRELTVLQMAGLVVANVLAILYTVIMVVTRGQRTAHDYAAQTKVVSA